MEGYALKIYDYDGAKNLCGERIRQARVVKRMTQGDLTAKMQLTGVRIEREAISKIESGERFVADYELGAGRDHGLAGRRGIKNLKNPPPTLRVGGGFSVSAWGH